MPRVRAKLADIVFVGPSRAAIWRSLKPICFASRRVPSDMVGSKSTISFMFARNHGSMCVTPLILSTDQPRLERLGR